MFFLKSFIDPLTYIQCPLNYMFDKLKIYNVLSNVLWSIQWYNELVLCWCVLHAPCLNSPGATGCALNSTTGAWPKQEKFTLSRHIFSNLGFPAYFCCLVFVLFPALSWLWTTDIWLTNDVRLFPSVYLWQHYRRFMWPCPLFICVTYTVFDLTGYTHDYTAGAWRQEVILLLLSTYSPT